MANYADFLGNFNFNIIYKTTKANANADYCSRAVKDDQIDRETQVSELDDFDIFMVKQIDQLPTSSVQIASETRKDAKLGEIIRILESGKSLHSYGYKSPEINYRMAGNCLTFEHRVVIPEKLRMKILQDLHSAHLGIVKMKGIARSFVYWPGIDKDIESVARSCVHCSERANEPPKARDHHWHYPKGPWERIHVDYAGPFLGSMLLIVADAYSKWIEVKVTSSSKSIDTINILDELFTNYGVPTIIVTDNGTCFASAEFKEFLTRVGVKYHKFTAPYHPSTNGQAERSVQTVKNALKSAGASKNDLQKHLNIFLRYYRIAPHATTGKPPSLLFMGRVLRTHLNLLLPGELSSEIGDKQYMKLEPSFRTVAPMQNVYFRSYGTHDPKWLPGLVLNRLGDLHYEILYKGKRMKRHIDQIRGKVDMNMANETKLSAETVQRRRRSQFNGDKGHSLPHESADNSFTDSTSFSTPQGDLTNTPNTTIDDYSAPQSVD
ncbi:uncharacterized protein K02A2.6-like [Lucilia cuprina]|uniref:uncharacterized protein K02A2.6-like n=1 Tax=Lucilia cuprina TaxID=7375 RepID=UPI001F0578CC|nr:uncharacterized protein K02A2.6-like [Lucilia cuprina]